MTAKFRFAPVSSHPSDWVGLVAGYFMLNGAFVALLGILGVVYAVRTGKPFGLTNILSLLIGFGSAGAMFWAGTLLNRQQKKGGYIAAIFMILPILSWLVGGNESKIGVVFSVLGLIILAMIWRDLEA